MTKAAIILWIITVFGPSITIYGKPKERTTIFGIRNNQFESRIIFEYKGLLVWIIDYIYKSVKKEKE